MEHTPPGYFVFSPSLAVLAKEWRTAFALASRWMGRTAYLSDLDAKIEAAMAEAETILSNIADMPARDLADIEIKLDILSDWHHLATEMENRPIHLLDSIRQDVKRLVNQASYKNSL